jgi:large subunit ribosomal protein L9
MKVILVKPVKGLGNTGDTVSVKDGFGRNYLMPQKLALPANLGSAKALQHQARIVETRIVQERKNAETMMEKLSAFSCSLERHAGEEDKLFGSVTTRDIAAALNAEGFDVDHSQVVLEESIKKLGVYQVPVKLLQDHVATVKVWVVAK